MTTHTQTECLAFRLRMETEIELRSLVGRVLKIPITDLNKNFMSVTSFPRGNYAYLTIKNTSGERHSEHFWANLVKDFYIPKYPVAEVSLNVYDEDLSYFKFHIFLKKVPSWDSYMNLKEAGELFQ